MDKIKNLLQQVSIIQKKYDEVAKITGENFNIFSILSMERREVKTHSAFLGELLNPKGSHGLKDSFLQLFIKEVFKETLIEFETASSNTITEEYIAQINEDKTNGGRVDIVIKDAKGRVILIENKIDAYEQKNQLIRYRNAYPKAEILFLTLTGYASNTSNDVITGQKDYLPISYEIHIVNWLEICLKEAVNYPMLREAIKQYIYLIKKITNQTSNNKMSGEIKKLILNDVDSINSSKEIYKTINELNKELERKLDELIKLSNEPNFIDDINSKIELINRVEKFETSKKYDANGYMFNYTISRTNLPEIILEVCITDSFTIETSTYTNDLVLNDKLKNEEKLNGKEYDNSMKTDEIAIDLKNRLLAVLETMEKQQL